MIKDLKKINQNLNKIYIIYKTKLNKLIRKIHKLLMNKNSNMNKI